MIILCFYDKQFVFKKELDSALILLMLYIYVVCIMYDESYCFFILISSIQFSLKNFEDFIHHFAYSWI